MAGEQFTPMPTWIRKSNLSDRQKMLWLYLREVASNNYVVWAFHRTLAAKLGSGVTPRMVRFDLERLEECGAIGIIRWIRDDGNQTCNSYVTWPAEPADFSVAEMVALRKGGRPGSLWRGAVADAA